MTTIRLADVEVPRIGLGTNRLTTAPEHIAFLRDAVTAGVRHIDTAHGYTGGDSERAIGGALAGAAAEVLVATKGGYGGRGQGRPEVLRAQIEQSLRSLGTEAIGLYYLHRVDPGTPLEESLGAIKDHVDRGLIRHVGLSDVDVAQIERGWQAVPLAAPRRGGPAARRRRPPPRRHAERRRARLAAAALARGPADPGHALDRAPAREPRGARARAQRRGARSAGSLTYPRQAWRPNARISEGSRTSRTS